MKIAVVVLSLLVLILGLSLVSGQSKSKWAGIDEAVVGKFAKEANREASPPLIDIGKGDLALFVFLIAGTIGGFFAGYFFRELFPPKPKGVEENEPHV